MRMVKLHMLVTVTTRLVLEREVPDDWSSDVFFEGRNPWTEEVYDDAISQAAHLDNPEHIEAECEDVR